MTGDTLLHFVNNILFPVLKGKDVKEGDKILYYGIKVNPNTPTKKSIIKSTFEDANNYMKDGVYLRQIVETIDEIEFDDVKESHAFGFVYEEILRELQSAGSAGEFYTPRAVTQFMAKMIEPKLGEKMADFACGTGGLLPLVDDYAKSYEELEQLNKKFPEDMKKSILQYAFQGKLVEQRKEEGTAEELYKQIQEEKQKLIKEGKIKKQKELLEITEDEIPFDIPESWRWVRLGEVIDLVNPLKKTEENHKYLEVRYLRNQIEPKVIDKGNYVTKGTLAILVDGENSGEIFEIIEDGYLGSTLKSLDILQFVYKEFIIKFLKSKQSELRGNKVGAAIPHLNKKLLKNYLLPLPPLEEQKRIVVKIEELLPTCENLNVK